MKKFTCLLLSMAFLFIITSCNKVKETGTGKPTKELSFTIKAGEHSGGLKSTNTWSCFEVPADYVKVQIDDSLYNIDVFYINDIPYTNTIKLTVGAHTVKEFTLWSDNNTPANFTDDVLLAATPHAGSIYAGFVITPINIPFTIDEFKKLEFPIEVVCYEADHYDDFGFTYFQLTEIVVREETFFGDICIRNINDYLGSMYAQQSQGLQLDMPAIFKIEVYHNGTLTGTFNNEAWKGEGQPLKVAYGDNLHQADHFEFKLYVLVRKIAGFSYEYFHKWTFDDAQVIPQGADGVVDFVLGPCFPAADVIIPFSGTFNEAPVANNAGQSGNARLGQLLTGSYTYYDEENDLQGASTFKWYRADDASGLNETEIPGATGLTYTLQIADLNKYIRFAVVPVALTGTIQGTEVKALAYAGPVTSTSFTCGNPLIDTRDGKSYGTVLIGTQCWMKENLNVGSRINGSQNQLNNAIIEKYCFNDLETNCDIYGGLYQWNEMMDYTPSSYSIPSGRQGICPTGWHVPSDDEWTILTNNLGRGSVAGGKMKEAGTVHWSSPNTAATNESGFTALPGGYRIPSGTFKVMGSEAGFWSSLEFSSFDSYYRYLTFSSGNAIFFGNKKTNGYSGRCLSD